MLRKNWTDMAQYNRQHNIIQYHTVQYIQFPNKSVDIRQTTEAAAQLQRSLAISTKGITEDPRLIITRVANATKNSNGLLAATPTACGASWWVCCPETAREVSWMRGHSRHFLRSGSNTTNDLRTPYNSLQFHTTCMSFMDSSFVLLHVMYFIWMFRHGLSTINHNTCPTVGHCVDGVDAYCEARALKSQHFSAFSLGAKSCESDNLKMDPAFWCGHVGVTLEYFFYYPSVYDLHWSHYYSEVIHIQNNLFF